VNVKSAHTSKAQQQPARSRRNKERILVDLSKLPPKALAAAMKTGTEEWGQRASIFDHAMYVEPQTARKGHYLKCRCGCGGKAKFRAMANGICMGEGCELSMHRWAKRSTTTPNR
jgi:hypothetical protein